MNKSMVMILVGTGLYLLIVVIGVCNGFEQAL